MSTWSCIRRERSLVTINPGAENSCSNATDVASMQRYRGAPALPVWVIARCPALTFHQSVGFVSKGGGMWYTAPPKLEPLRRPAAWLQLLSLLTECLCLVHHLQPVGYLQRLSQLIQHTHVCVYVCRLLAALIMMPCPLMSPNGTASPSVKDLHTHTHIYTHRHTYTQTYGCQYCTQLSQPTLSGVTGCLTLGLGWWTKTCRENTQTHT